MKNHISQGFSLIELLLYIALIAVFSSLLASLFIVLGKSRAQLEARSEVHQALAFASEKMAQDIRSATSVTTPSSPGVEADTLVLTVDGSVITYQVTAGVLERQVDALAAEPMTARTMTVSSLSFIRTQNMNALLQKNQVGIQLALTVAYQTAGVDWSYHASKQTTVLMRNN